MDSTPEIELDAAQALFAARMLEAAVHHPGPWSFKWGEIEVPATKTFTEGGVVFTGQFPEVCWLRRPDTGLLILCEGMVMGMRRIDEVEHPGDTGFEVTWKVLTRRTRVGQ
jgi:hypothetical protein